MLPRLLLLAGLAGLAGAPGRLLAEDAPMPRRAPEEPKKPTEPKKPGEPKKEPKAPAEEKAAPTSPNMTPKKAEKPGALAPYDKIITKDAVTQQGVFTVHKVDDNYYFEITPDKFNRLLLMRAEVARGSVTGAHNGTELGVKFVRLERRENKLFVIEANYDKRSGPDVAAALEASGLEPIIFSFQVLAEGKDRSVVISVANVFLNDVLDLGARRAAGGAGGSIDGDKSFIQSLKAFPTNIEARAQLTLRGGGGGGLSIPGIPGLGGGGSSAKTAVVHYSLNMLPETPMQGRYFDSRVGYFTEQFADYSGKNTWVQDKEYIARFRLEKKDPAAEVSEPVKPIVFYLAPEIPERLRAAMKKGVEDWKPAFEKAGFKNAIQCELTPPAGFDPEDARYNVIRWVAEPTANAMGPHVHDPRSGETISAHIIFWHDILKLVHMWYFVQCSAQDERARKFPFPQDLQDELIRYVVAHEVGHTLGLRHNHRASQAYSIEQLRDPKFVAENGNVASIMSYGRYNYVAQPEDKIPVKDLIPKLAPYDLFAIAWGYKPIDAKTPEGEKKTLDEWASRQIKEPFLRFGGEDGPSTVDPTVLTENIGSDAVKATELGFKNMDRVAEHLLKATTAPGEDFDTLREAYTAMLTHRRNWFGAVLKQVGGVVETRTLATRGEQFARVPKEKQKAAVAFIVKEGFKTPKAMMDPAVINSLKYTGVANDVMSLQRALLTGLLNSSRLNRLLDMEVLDPDKAYPIAELVADVKAGVWSELKTDAPKIDPVRRNLQRVFVDTLKAEFEAAPSGGGLPAGLPPRLAALLDSGPSRNMELRAVARMTLRELKKEIDESLPKVKDPATKLHLMDLSDEIDSVFARMKK